MGTVSTIHPVQAIGNYQPAPSRNSMEEMLFGGATTPKTKSPIIEARVEAVDRAIKNADGIETVVTEIHIIVPQTLTMANLRESKPNEKGVSNGLFFTVAVPPMELCITAGDGLREIVKYTKPSYINPQIRR